MVQPIQIYVLFPLENPRLNRCFRTVSMNQPPYKLDLPKNHSRCSWGYMNYIYEITISWELQDLKDSSFLPFEDFDSILFLMMFPFHDWVNWLVHFFWWGPLENGHPTWLPWSHKANKHKTDPHGRTPLHTATRGGHFAVVRYLMEAGAGVGVSKNPKEQGWF